MRTIFASVLVVLSIAMPRALAGDVAYQLETKALSDLNQPAITAPSSMELNNRAWAAPGIEEADEVIGREYLAYRTERRLLDRISPNERNDRLWAKLELWPRTRYLFDYGRVIDSWTFCFGSINGAQLHR